MNDELVPSWIKKIKNADDAAKEKVEAARVRDLADKAAIENGAPKFWNQLAKDFEIAANALSKIGITATCSSLVDEQARVLDNRRVPEHGIRIDMRAGFPRVRVGYVNVWYTEGTYHLRIYRVEDEEKEEQRIPLGLNATGEVCAVADNAMLDPEQTAEEILRPLVNYIRS
jgi:hypothetical protein